VQKHSERIEPDGIYCGDCRTLIDRIAPDSVALSIWSPPYFVGKDYEKHLSYAEWVELLQTVIAKHARVLKQGAFLAININDILCFPDESIPRFQAENMGGNRLPVTRDDVLRAMAENPGLNRYQIADLLGVSEQTVDRRLNNNNIRGGKHSPQTRVQLAGQVLDDAAREAGLYLYDRRIWAKDPCWQNSQWHTNSYRAVDEFEYVYIFWKSGITRGDRGKLSRAEWAEWGSRGVWHIRSVRSNRDHEAKFPMELPRRLIRLLTGEGDLVLDPFVGSGTSAMAAIELRRRYIGIELSEKYARLAQLRCGEGSPLPTDREPTMTRSEYLFQAG